MTIDYPDFREFAARSVKELGAIAHLQPSSDLLANAPPDLPDDQAIATFKMLYAVDADPALYSLLQLPGEIRFYWQSGEAMGEFNLFNLNSVVHRQVDASLQDRTLGGIALANARIVDEVANVGGPIQVLAMLEDGKLAAPLHYFDTRAVFPLPFSAYDYVQLAMDSFAPLYWQCLFIAEPLALSRANALEQSLAFLEGKAKPEALARLRQALSAKRG